MQYSQEHLKTMVYAKFGGQTECIMGNWKIENWSAHKMRIPNASMHNVFLTCSYSVLLFCFSLGKKDKFRRNNRCVKSCYTCQETFTNMIWRRQEYTIHFTGMCSVILSIFCQMYLFFCYNSQRFLTTVNVWPLVNNVHIAVHDR